MVTSQTMDWSFSHATVVWSSEVPSPIILGSTLVMYLSWSASFPTGGQGCYAALFSLRPLDKPGRCDPGIQSTTPGITISVYLWMIPGDPEIVWEDGRSDFDALYVLAWRHPGTTVHYPITNSCPLGKKLKSVSIDWVMQTLCGFLFQLFFGCGSFWLPNFLYSQRIALLSFKASNRNSSSLDLDCATIADILLILMIGAHFLSCSIPSPPALTPAWKKATGVSLGSHCRTANLILCQKHWETLSQRDFFINL